MKNLLTLATHYIIAMTLKQLDSLIKQHLSEHIDGEFYEYAENESYEKIYKIESESLQEPIFIKTARFTSDAPITVRLMKQNQVQDEAQYSKESQALNGIVGMVAREIEYTN